MKPTLQLMRTLAGGLCLLAGVLAPVRAAPASGAIAAAQVGASAKLIRPITVNRASDMAFGSIVKPTTGAGTVALSAAGARSVTGTGATALASTPAQAARFTIDGEGAQAINVTVAGTFLLHSSGKPDLTVTTTHDLPGGSALQTLPGTLGTPGRLTLNVGGAFGLNSATPSANYLGQFSVTAAYY